MIDLVWPLPCFVFVSLAFACIYYQLLAICRSYIPYSITSKMLQLINRHAFTLYSARKRKYAANYNCWTPLIARYLLIKKKVTIMYSSESMNYDKNASLDLCFLSSMGRSDNIVATLLCLRNEAARMVAWSFAFCKIPTWLAHLCKLPAGMTPVSMTTEPLPRCVLYLPWEENAHLEVSELEGFLWLSSQYLNENASWQKTPRRYVSDILE